MPHSALLRPGLAAAACVLALASGAIAMRTRSLHLRLTPFEGEPGTDRIPCEYLALPSDTVIE